MKQLAEPIFVFSRDMRKAKSDFWEFAKTRVRMHSTEQAAEFNTKYFPPNEKPSSAAGFIHRCWTKGADPEMGIASYEISINSDYYGVEYADLVPYALEHEIYEGWLRSKRGVRVNSREKAHVLARRHQMRLAMRDGKAEREIDFYVNRIPTLKSEFEDAYKKAAKKLKIRK